MSHVPVRQCMVCRQHREKGNLIRIVRFPAGQIEYDPKQNKQGRGFYICPNDKCLNQARKKGLLENCFSEKISRDLYMILAKKVIDDKASCVKLLGFAVRSYNAVTGLESVLKTAKKGTCHLIVMESGTGETTRKQIERMSRSADIPLLIYREDTPLEKIVGKASCRCVGITGKAFADSILREMKQETRNLMTED